MKKAKDEAVVASPCVDNCCLNEDDVCMGCFRSLQEILDWGGADTSTRLEVLGRVEGRKKG